MTLKSKTLIFLNLLYCYIPLFLFLIGWVKFWIAIPATICLLFFLWRYYLSINESSSVTIRRTALFLVVFIFFAVCISAGMGNIFPQESDYEKHNAMLQDLVRYSWPVIYDKFDTALLTYYIGAYLPPAVIGKLFRSVRCADYLMGIWGYLGVILVYMNLIILTKAHTIWKQLFILCVFILFSGMLYPLQHLIHIICPDILVYPDSDVSSVGHLRALFIDGSHWEYRSVFTDLQWVHQQTIIPWLCCCTLMMRREDYANYALIILPAYISGTWAFVGIVLIALLLVIAELINSKGTIWKQVLSASNLYIILIPGMILTFYFLGNMIVGNDTSAESEFAIDFSAHHLIYHILFIVFMFGIYAILIEKEYRKDILFWIICGELIGIPFFKSDDFIMCTSIPALFILLTYVIRFMINNLSQDKIRKIILLCCLIIGARSPIIQIREAALHMPQDHFKEKSLLECTNLGNPEIDDAMKYQYYTYNTDNSIFYKYIMRK